MPWEEFVLSLYNPIEETRLLKKASDIETEFLKLRKNHQQRHDFFTYFTPENIPDLFKPIS